MSITILGIESSCDDTAAAVVRDGFMLSNIIAGQDVHKRYGGVVPEIASREHQANIVPVTDMAISSAGIDPSGIDAIAYTRGPGLLGSLLVGSSFAKGLSLSLGVPLIEVNHLPAHILVHFIKDVEEERSFPGFPFLALVVSGGHTQLVIVRDHLEMEIIGETTDDAAGEAFDKCAKVMGLDYPGGPLIDRLAKDGDGSAFSFNIPVVDGLDFSFSGLKTSFLYSLRKWVSENPDFVESNINDLSASIQSAIVKILTAKLMRASEQTGIREIVLAGGVAANSGLRRSLMAISAEKGWRLYLPDLKFTTDNAAMIAITGYYKYLKGDFSSLGVSPMSRFPI